MTDINSQENSPEKQVGNLLLAKGLTLTVAESATAGLISARIVNVPGSSAYFLGGIVSYHNNVKQNVLGVKAETLSRYGAVSEQCAKEMAQGVRLLLKSDIALADTGIAGPGGESPEKPAGLFYLAISTPQEIYVQKHIFEGNRMQIRLMATEKALLMLINYLENKSQVKS